MSEMNRGLIEKYQNMLLKDPASKVFAPLSEAYRKMGWLKEARETCEQGLSYHPHFAGGYVALAKIGIDESKFGEATQHLKKAVELSPENLLAHQLLADCYLRLKQAKEALKSFKMVLFLSPENEKAQKAVKRLESLTADEYEEELFSMKPLEKAVEEIENQEMPTLEPLSNSSVGDSTPQMQRALERHLSLADAFAVRGDLDRALESLENAQHEFGIHPEVQKRIKMIQRRRFDDDFEESAAKPESSAPLERDKLALQNKIRFLEAVLEKLKTQSAPRS